MTNKFWRKGFLILGLILLGFLVFIFVREFGTVVSALRQARWSWLILAILAQIATYIFLTLLFYDILIFFGYKLKFLRLFKISFTLNYLNQALPALGLAGLYFMIYALKKDKVKPDKSIIAVIFYYIFIHLAFIFLLIYAAFQLVFRQELTQIEALATLGSICVVFIILLVLFLLLKQQKVTKKILGWFIWPIRKIFLSNADQNQSEKEEIEKILNVDYLTSELGKNLSQINHAKSKITGVLAYSFLIHLFDAATIYFLFYAFNFHAGYSVALISFVFGSLFAFVSFIPAGIGIEEVSRGLVLNWFGIPLGAAMLVSVAFRALGFWINIPIGTLVYRNLTKSGRRDLNSD